MAQWLANLIVFRRERVAYVGTILLEFQSFLAQTIQSFAHFFRRSSKCRISDVLYVSVRWWHCDRGEKQLFSGLQLSEFTSSITPTLWPDICHWRNNTHIIQSYYLLNWATWTEPKLQMCIFCLFCHWWTQQNILIPILQKMWKQFISQNDWVCWGCVGLLFV